jgi:hypothetical protein
VLGRRAAGGRTWSGWVRHVTLVTVAESSTTRLRRAQEGDCDGLSLHPVPHELRAALATWIGSCSPADDPSTPRPSTDLTEHQLEEESWR